MKDEKSRILAHLDANRGLPAHRSKVGALLLVAGFSLFGVMAAFGTAPSHQEILDFQQEVVESLAPAIEAATPDPAEFFVREERVRQGDTAATLLSRLGIQDEQALAQLRQLPQAQSFFRQLRPGKVVFASTNASGELQTLTFPLNGPTDDILEITKQEGRLQITQKPGTLIPQITAGSGEIRSSLFAATDKAGLSDGIAIQLAEIFGSSIDFHKDLRKGDHFSVIYKTLYSQGQPVRTGRILAAEFINNNTVHRAIWFEGKDGQGYFNADGKNIRKTFLRSPLEFSRITSGFTRARFHPIFKTWRSHKGVDYAAPMGTAIKATGDGIVEFAGKQGGYGNLVILRHNNRMTTYYGHMKGFAAGIRKGSRVQQGDTIGYVGMTGWATGPHVHYEFRISNVHQNPLTVALPSASSISPSQMAQFRDQADPLLYRLSSLRSVHLAQAR